MRGVVSAGNRGFAIVGGVATPSRFELPISSLTGRRVRPLHHGAGLMVGDSGLFGWWVAAC